MNIFVLSECPIEAAQMHIDKHVVKMCLELAQQLATAVISYGAAESDIPKNKLGLPYRATHINHPTSKWIRASRNNFEWGVIHSLALCEEYTHRYNKRHACQSPIEQLQSMASLIPDGPLTNFALAMPDEYKMDCPVQSYRNYYLFDKSQKIAMKWTNRDIPFWFANNYFGGMQ